jgi:hypothetical protein
LNILLAANRQASFCKILIAQDRRAGGSFTAGWGKKFQPAGPFSEPGSGRESAPSEIREYMSRLTSAAPIQGFNARILREIFSGPAAIHAAAGALAWPGKLRPRPAWIWFRKNDVFPPAHEARLKLLAIPKKIHVSCTLCSGCPPGI